ELGEGVAAPSDASIEAMEDKIAPGTPLVVILGPSFSNAAGLKEVQALIRRRPEVASIMVVEELSTQMLQQALRAGVRDVVAAPTESGQLLEAVERAAGTIHLLTASSDEPGALTGTG